jgi:hypothetical protein
MLICVSGGPAYSQSSAAIERAKFELEQLAGQLLRVEKEARAEIERAVAEQVNTAPKGEFETTKEYEARRTKADKLRQQIEERINRQKNARKEDLNRRLNQILTMEFSQPFEARLGVYDADRERFPLLIQPDSREALLVPRLEARELKENFSRAEKSGIFGLHLDAENHAGEYLLAGRVSYRGRTYPLENRAMSVARAMYMLYGNYNPANNRAKWRAEADPWGESDEEYQALEAIPIFSKSFRENNRNKFILLTGSVAEGEKEFDGCHACGVKIGMAVFSQKESGWKLETGQKDVGTYGAYGIPPQASLIKIGVDRYALIFSSGDMHQGVTDEAVDYIDRVDGIFKEILSLNTAEDTSGAGTFGTPEDNISFDSRIDYIPGNNPAHFDIKVTTRGRRGARAGRRLIMRPFVEVKIYRFADGAYKLSAQR